MDRENQRPLWRLSEPLLRQWLEQLLRGPRRVIAPIEKNHRRTFSPIGAPGEAVLVNGNSLRSPKEFIFPRTEALFHYRLRSDQVELVDPPASDPEQVLFGLHPCDAAGLMRLDSVLSADPFYARRRARTTVVALACSECQPACFCTAVGGSPTGEEGADIILADRGDVWLARILTNKGEELVAGIRSFLLEAYPGEWDEVVDQGLEAAGRVQRVAIERQTASLLERRFEAHAWNKTAQRCISCSICTYLCPSCSCFDIADEGHACSGTRCRNWDSCSFALFTLHGSGHNPRSDQAARFRQRVLHKFAYFPLRYGGLSMCVGCGRCTEHCPVGIDIYREVVSAFKAAQEISHAAG
jgi:sulfhydrogenase subunit beta (sulfur reductase)